MVFVGGFDGVYLCGIVIVLLSLILFYVYYYKFYDVRVPVYL